MPSTQLMANECKYSDDEMAKLYEKYTGSALEKPYRESIAKVSSISIGMKGFTDEDFLFLCPFKELTSLKIYNDDLPKEDQLKGKYFHRLPVWTPKLTFIDFDYNDIDPKNLVVLNQLKELKTVKLIGNRFGEKDFRILAKLEIPRQIIGDNLWKKAKKEDLVYLFENTKAKSLWLGGTSDESYIDDPKMLEALEESRFPTTMTKIEISGEISSAVFNSLISDKNSFKEIVCVEGVFGLESIISGDRVNQEIHTLECGLDLELKLQILDSLPLINEVFIKSPDFDYSFFQSREKKYDISIGSRTNYSEMIELTDVMKMVEALPENKIIFMGLINFLENGESTPFGYAFPKIKEICQPGQCFRSTWGGFGPLE